MIDGASKRTYAVYANTKGIREYTKAFKLKEKPHDESVFEKFIHTFVKTAAPTSIVVGSEKKTKERSFSQTSQMDTNASWHVYDVSIVIGCL